MEKNNLRILGLLGAGAALATALVYASKKRKNTPNTAINPQEYVEHRKEERFAKSEQQPGVQPDAPGGQTSDAEPTYETAQDTTEEIQEKTE